MAQAMRPQPAGSLFATDGKPHPLQDTLLAVTLVLGVVAFVTAHVPQPAPAQLLGRPDRHPHRRVRPVHLGDDRANASLLIIGLGASAVGFYLGMAHGGLFGGVIG